ncbi:hypothetical protein SARC_00179 [Sphaeroforma arctica JP610]|uniref:Uncharacterized protein n=1 Tax=Sphaeroforma arctica JP610 TaxID=667725 RepID=A0A0L0GFB0_9EUKA|nr:hypothetical protein SARC_00179 [Sphaeroforma arctica JP610]KNC87745.1 hypothetical protein SARC_00179 [Sphaeroforma arctica JP610]|eukprot:XP_014161647.1 hypothetical protein SARC_00179 [Sphaeroforma arctica JP610]
MSAAMKFKSFNGGIDGRASPYGDGGEGERVENRLEVNQDAPFRVIREFGENSFSKLPDVSLVGWHLLLIGNRALERTAATALDPFNLGNYNTGRTTRAAAVEEVTTDPRRLLGQKLFDALVEYVVV